MSDEVGSTPTRAILSTTRLSLILSAFLIALLAAVGGLSHYVVVRIFDRLTPAVAHDLRWKAERGAAELARSMEFAAALADETKLAEVAAPYVNDADFAAIVVRNPDGGILYAHPKGGGAGYASVLTAPPLRLVEEPSSYGIQAKIEIEGGTVGQVIVQVSKARLLAGEKLERDIVKTILGGSVLALVVALFFVSFYIRPLVKVTERAFAELAERTREALESARLKSEFLANMSHEIRTPMNGVVGMAELLQKTELTKKQRRYARTITTSATALLTIINDILDFSKIEAGKLSVRPVETDVQHLAEEVSQLIAPQAQAKGLELLCVVNPEVPREVLVDHDRLRQVLTNVVGNAVKFTNKGSVVLRVGVKSTTSDGVSALIEFAVSDTGIGIAKEDQERVFELFSQVDGSLTRSRGGTGLGLTISRHLVRLMGGELSVESEVGVGSTFRFTIACEVLAGVGSRPPLGSLPHTLIVDDNETNRTVLEEMLDAWGVSSESVRSGEEALTLLGRTQRTGAGFGLALVDHEMDGMNGPELARKIRALHGDAAPRLVLLTSLGESGALDDVFDDGLTKPFLQDDLKRVLAGSSGKGSGGSESELFIGALRFPGRPRVLVAEDNPINREVMREILEELEIDCDVAENGIEALEHLAAHSYPLVLMDCQMPELDGYEATRRLRKLETNYANVPVVAVTAHAVVGEREKALAAGMTDYVTKPITVIRLMRVLARYLPTETARKEGELPRTVRPGEVALAAAVPAPPAASEPVTGRSVVSSRAPAEVVLDPGVHRSRVVANLFLATVPDQIQAVSDAVTSGDQSRIKAAAHKLKGGCLAIGARTMAPLCAQIEPGPEDGARLVELLRSEYRIVQELLEAELVSAGKTA